MATPGLGGWVTPRESSVDVVQLRDQVIVDDGNSGTSFVPTSDARIGSHASEELEAGPTWLEPPERPAPTPEAGS